MVLLGRTDAEPGVRARAWRTMGIAVDATGGVVVAVAAAAVVDEEEDEDERGGLEVTTVGDGV
jgi:hypothetical protein